MTYYFKGVKVKKYKVVRIMQYTEVAYIEANNIEEALDASSEVECVTNHDDTWMDSHAKEITDEEYESAGE